jgi:POT family proton-dependent oligopeptide transporter
VLWYLRDFVDTSPLDARVDQFFGWFGVSMAFKFSAEYVTVLTAGTIVVLQMVVSRIVRNRRALPSMVVGIVIGSLGFLCLGLATSIWSLVLGLVIFSIGEMTAHPKYISYVGLVAPQEKKATYMGYAFLYGVVGSLVGSNLGGELYQYFMSPLAGTGAGSVALRFWLGFALLGGCTAVAQVVYDRCFGVDSEATRRRARTVLRVVYALLALGSVVLFTVRYLGATEFPIKTAVLAGIMLLIGGGGFFLLLKNQDPTGQGPTTQR